MGLFENMMHKLIFDPKMTYHEGNMAFGHDSNSGRERSIANELQVNYQQAARDFASTGAQRPPQRRIAVCIGCNYPHSKRNALGGCINDATRWAELLRRNYDFEVVLMTDSSLCTPRGWSDQLVPTRDHIYKMLFKIVANMERGDCLAITFSGHGTRIRDKSGDEGDGFDECIVLPDRQNGTRLLTDDDIYQNVIARVPEGCKVTAVFDCCRSGGAMDLPFELATHRDSRGNVSIGNWTGGQKNQMPCRAEVTLITGCTSSQVSMEGGGKERSGVLSIEMIKLLSKKPYHWTYADVLSNTINNVFNNPYAGATPQCPTLSSSIPFDVRQRRFGPCQLTGIQIPGCKPRLSSDQSRGEQTFQEEIPVPSYLSGLR